MELSPRPRSRSLVKVLIAAALCASLALAALLSSSPGTADAKGGKLPHIKHVFTIVLENEDAASTFGPDAPKYLAKKLPSKGLFMPNYYGTAHFSLPNYIAMVSGQAPNTQTQLDCHNFNDFLPGTPAPDGQVIGTGCVYPSSVKTVANQLQDKGLDWRGYMEDMAAKAPAEPATCRHPAIGATDDTQAAEVGDQYATRHNPFMYFHSIIDNKSNCSKHVVDYTKLAKDLKKKGKKFPAYSFITPNLCHDGHDEPCVDGEPGGLVSANKFLQQTIPGIMKSAAYKDNGLIIVNFDEAESDASSCCDEQTGPNTLYPGFPSGPGGGRTGAVLLSPCIKPGTKTKQAYNHYSYLRSIEDNFGLKYMGYAGQDGLKAFGSDVYTKASCGKKKR